MSEHPTPKFPELEAEVSPYADKPMGVTAFVRRTLQKAGHREEAAEFTRRAFQASEETLLDLAREYITIR